MSNTKLLIIKEVAEELRCNSSYVYTLIKKGYLPALKLGSLKVRPQALENFKKWCEGKDFSDLDSVKPLGPQLSTDYSEGDDIEC